jgi:elongation factor G
VGFDAYRETITGVAEADYCHKIVMGGAGEFARVKLRVEPIIFDGIEFVNASPSIAIPAEFVAAMEKEISGRAQVGTLAGFQITGIKASLIGGSYHEIDSNKRVFRIAATEAFLQAVSHAHPKIVMAIMRVRVRTPEDFLEGIIGDINLRKGWIQTTNNTFPAEIEALIPACNLEGYEIALERMTHGSGSVSMALDHYEEVLGLDPDPRFPGAMAARVAG